MITPQAPNCGKCGLCLQVCPVYQQIKEEQVSPRARMQLIKAHEKKKLPSTPFLKEIMSKCLMCGSCSAHCPSGIDHYTAFMKMREQMAEDHGESVPIKSLIYLLAGDRRLRLGTGIARKGQRLLPGKIARTAAIGTIPLDALPRLNRRPFRDTHKETVLPKGPAKGTVAYFTGCATNYLFNDTGAAAVGILQQMGFKIILPKNQTCCAIPLLFHGAARQARKNITANITALEHPDVDAVVVDCSTCGEALKYIYPSFFKADDPEMPYAKAVAGKTTDLFTFIDRHSGLLDFHSNPQENIRVTYHAPCHSKNHFDIPGIVEKLIRKIPWVTYHKTADSHECCGGGGTFFYEFPETSKKMIDKKIENAKAVQATYWLTDCPVCRLNLAGHLKKTDNLRVVHPLTLISSAVTPNEG